MTITLLTPTGDRPEAFALCEKYMARQTIPYSKWVVMDDGELPTICTQGQQYLYCPQFKGKGSLPAKLRYAFSTGLVTTDVAFFIEDDDWYAPQYLETMLGFLEPQTEMIGEGCALYYNVRFRWWYDHHNMQHASLCSTMVTHLGYLKVIRACRPNVPFLDVPLWKSSVHQRIFKPRPQRLVIGIKSMPGRKGYGMGHRHHSENIQYDVNFTLLRDLIGADADNYAPYYQPDAPSI